MLKIVSFVAVANSSAVRRIPFCRVPYTLDARVQLGYANPLMVV